MKILKENKEKTYMTVGDVKNHLLKYFNDIPDYLVVEFENSEPYYGDFVLIGDYGYIDLGSIETHFLYSAEISSMLHFVKDYESLVKDSFGWNLDKIFRDSGFEYDESKSLYKQLYDSVKIDAGHFLSSFVNRIKTHIDIAKRKNERRRLI